ncbi:Protein of unknown function [Thermobacillus xylanilyticus]|uniref:Uncharacterized protein n=1 Tax=Thermobacillus xylanilyticus TaxID=76633 RepID=A0ABN7RIN5_THEXY|nr:Protein of unknown function [Thermobacillus xylanilyticus]
MRRTAARPHGGWPA